METQNVKHGWTVFLMLGLTLKFKLIQEQKKVFKTGVRMLFLDFFKSCSGFALCKLTDSATRDISLPLSYVGTALTRAVFTDSC